MATTTDYLNKLIEQKNTLADNLVTKGVEATHEESFKTLIPKILNIASSSGGGTEKYYLYDNGVEMNNHTMTIYHKSSSSKKAANWIYLYGYYMADLSSDKIINNGYSKLCITLMSDSTQFSYTPKYLKVLCTDEGGATLTENDYLPNGNILKSTDIISYPDTASAGSTYKIDISNFSEFYLHFENVNTDTYILSIWLEKEEEHQKNMIFDNWEHVSGSDGYNFDKDGWTGPFTANNYIGINKLFTYTKSFEIMINFILDSIPNRTNVLIGCSAYNVYTKSPSVELQPTKIWAGLSYTGTTWDKSVNANIEWEINKEYYIKYSYNADSKILKLEMSRDGITWEALASATDIEIGYQCINSEYFELGGIARSGAHNFSCGKINLFKSYIKLDNKLFWGILYK